MSKPNLAVNIAGVALRNPVITASGTFGFGREYSKLFSLNEIGGISLKGMTLEERNGNPPPRVAETPSGMLNCVGLQNPGIDYFIENELPFLKKQDTVLICNIAGNTISEYCKMAERLSSEDIDMIELNISCPNVKKGGAAFGVDCESAAAVTREVRRCCNKPLIVKLSPAAADITAIAQAVEAEGADAVSLINTLLGMRIDINTRRPILSNNVGGLSGAAIFPVALRMVWQVARRVKIPVIGMGGVSRWQDAIEMMLAGACAVQVGTASFSDPFAMIKIRDGIEKYLIDNNFESVSDICGKVVPYDSGIF